ncbi:D-alanine transaminase [Rhodocyclaceae bacterium]|nr:D-alanine transaminase [Rhodocyclaceae bacterium]
MIVYLNDQFMPIEEARIPVLDRGFIFGDGVYEVIPVYSRRAFRLAEHLKRLQHSLDGIRLPNPHSDAEWTALVNELISRHAEEDQYLYLHITRGVARRDHAFPSPPVAPTVFIMSNPLLTPPAELLHSGVAAVSAPDNRWLRCDIKAIALLPNVLLRQMAVDAGAAETILIRNGEFMTEGAASNIFAVKNGELLAPPKDNFMLPGITYDVILELAAANGIPHGVRKVLASEVFSADELLLTSSTKEVLAITTLDGKPVGNGKPGAMFSKLYRLYQDYKRDVMRKAPSPGGEGWGEKNGHG